MNKRLTALLVLFLFLSTCIAQTNDTLINVNGHKLHFNIWKGKGIPILFESGGGADASVWNSILKPISKITGATLITYSRAGFGKSTIDSTETDIKKHGIISGIEDLEIALKKLGFSEQIMLVSHSYGGYYSTLYSNRHPEHVKSVVLIDVNHHFIQKFIDELWKGWEPSLEQWKLSNNLGMYYMGTNIRETAKKLSELSIPNHIPVVDVVSGVSHLANDEQKTFWIEDHKRFVENHPNCIGVTADGTQHSIWEDNPSLIIVLIGKAYAEMLDDREKIKTYNKTLEFVMDTLSKNKLKKNNDAQ